MLSMNFIVIDTIYSLFIDSINNSVDHNENDIHSIYNKNSVNIVSRLFIYYYFSFMKKVRPGLDSKSRIQFVGAMKRTAKATWSSKAMPR